MTTDKERAEVYRELADQLPTGAYWGRSALTHKADLLDPPKPQWADGQWVVATGIHYRWSEEDGYWYIGGDNLEPVNDNDVYDPKPLRVLADDEIALPREVFERFSVGITAREVSNQYRAAGEKFAARAMEAYADALDAEAGEQS